MCSRKRLTFIKDFINNESVCHFMVVQLFKLSTNNISVLGLCMKLCEGDNAIINRPTLI